MAATNNECRVSFTVFAKHLGTSYRVIKDAADAGKMPKGYDPDADKKRQIIVAVAYEEFGKVYRAKKGLPQIDIVAILQRKTADAVNKLDGKYTEAVTAQEKRIIDKAEKSLTDGKMFVPGGFQVKKTKANDADWDDEDEKEQIPRSETWVDPDEPKPPKEWDGIGPIPSDITFPEALRIERIEMARMKELQRKEKEGLLVSKSEVNKQLQVAGMEIRNMLQRFPASIVDKVMASKSRHEASNELTEGIHELLKNIGGVIETAINKPSANN